MDDPTDSSPPPDSSSPDSSSPDSSPTDPSSTDSSSPDSSPTDSSPTDASPTDASPTGASPLQGAPVELAYYALLGAGMLAVTPANERTAPPDPSWSAIRVDLEARDLDAEITRAGEDLARGVDSAARRLRALRSLRAMRSFERGERDAAHDEWEALATEDPRDADPLKTRSLFFAAGEDLDVALDDLNRAAARAPGDPEVYRQRGGVFVQRGEWDRALPDYRRLVHLRPRDLEALDRLASALRFTGDPDAAIRVLGRAIKLAPWRADLYASRAGCFSAKGARREAILDLDCCIERDPTNARALRERASAHYFLDDSDRQLADLSRAIELDPTHAGTLHSRALIHKRRGLHGEAIADLSAAIALDPKCATYRLGRAELDLEIGDVARASADLEIAIEDARAREEKLRRRRWTFDDEDEDERDFERRWLAMPHWLRGHARRRLGDREGAVADYEHALWLHRRLLGETAWSARHCTDKGAPAQLDRLDTLVLLEPEEAEWLLLRARIWMDRDKLEEARADLDRAIAAAPHDPKAFALLAALCHRQGDDRAAIVALSRAIDLDPLEAEHFMWRGLYRLLLEGPSPEAEADVRRGAALARDGDPEHWCLAIYLERCERWREALEVHDERIEAAPQDGQARADRAFVRLKLGQDEPSLRAALADLDAAIERGIEDNKVLDKRAEVLTLLDST